MKIRTEDEFQDAVDSETAWRKKELSSISSNIATSKKAAKITALRAGIALLYAHWEGLIKNLATYYLCYVSFQNCRYDELKCNFMALSINKHSTDEDVDFSSKVKIEDDPYYFKKYVFSYDEIGLENANNWLIENVQKETTISLIQDYITDTRQFAKYKENNINEPIYTFFIELVTKLHCFPMKTAETKNINSIDYFLKNELEKLRAKPRKSIDINQSGVETFVDMDIDYGNIKEVCEKWNFIFNSESEDKK